MNKIYKVIWNRVRHCYVVVSEIAKNHGKEHSTNLCVSKRLVALTLAIGLSLSSYAFVAAEDTTNQGTNLGNGASAYYDDKGNLTIGDAKTVAEGKNQKGEHNTTIGTQTDTLRNVTEGDTEGQPLDDDKNTKLVDGEGKAHDLTKSTEAGGSTAVGYQNKAEGDNSTAIGNNAKITNKPVTYYVDADGKKTASADNAAWYKDASGNPTKVPQVFRDAGGKTTTTPQYVHTYTEKDPTTGENVTKTEITSDATKADQKDGQPVYNYQKTDNTPYLYTVTLYQAASNSIAAGTNVTAKGSNAVAVGYNSSADNSAVAIGDTAEAKENAVAMGKDTKATAKGSIALGKGSEADRDGGVAGWDPKTGTASTNTDAAWQSGEGALSIGNGGASRQITNVAAGSEDSDAVNLAQLKEAMTHYYSVKTTADTDAAGKNNYLNDGATGNNALAAGVGATASSDDATAVGTYANATASQATAIGRSASASSYQDTAIGYNAGAHGTYATAVGSSASATSFQSTAIGYNAGAHGSYAIAMGNGASATNTNAIAIGASANVPYENSTAVGASAKATDNQATAIGSSAEASGTYATALGNSASATSYESTAIGSGAGAHGDYAIAMGNGASATNSYAVAIGAGANAPSYQATALGNGASAYSSYATALGSGATAQSSDDTAIGSSAKASGGDATALGYNAQATAPNATALGSGASAYYHAIAIGAASASSSYALAAGDGANAQEYQAIALGYNAKSNVTGGVALGSGSTANVDSGKTGLDPHTGKASTATGAPWVSTLGALSVGTVDSDGTATGTRQINGVAAGTQDTDAVNVAQLKAMETRINMHYYSVNSTLSGDGSNYDNTGASGTNALAAGPMASASGDNAVAIGYGAKAEGRSATAIGKNASATGQYAMAFGGLDTTDKQGHPVTMTNTASGASATAFGQGAQAKGAASLAFGHNTVAGVDGGGQQAVAFGEDTQALGGRSLAFGEKTIAKYNDSVAFGNDTRASSTGATAFGNRTRAISSYSTAWGNATVAADEESTAWGTDTIAGAKLDANGAVTNQYTENDTSKTEQMDVHGNLAYIRSDGTTAGIKQMKIDSGNELHDYVVLAGKDGNTYVRDYQGSLWKVNVAADGTVTVDTTAGTNGKVYNGKNGAKQSLAKTTVNGKEVAITPDNVLTKAHEGTNGYNIDGYANATAFGYSTEASGDNATAFGNDTKATAAGATAFGYKTLASGENATAFGESSIAAGKNSLAALGGTVSATATNAAAIGSGAQATLADSVALGSHSVTTRAKYKNLTSDAEKAAYAKGNSTGSAWEATDNAIAVGNDSTVTRQITGVAAGSLDTDAVNVAQLKAVDARHTTVSVGGQKATADDTVVKGGNLEMTRTTSNGQANYDVSLNKDIVLGQQEENKGGSIVVNSVGTFRNYDEQGNQTDYPMKEAVKIDGTTVSVVKNDGSDGGNDQRQVVLGVGQDTGGYVALYDNTGKKPTYIFNAISPGITYLKDKATNPDDANEFGRLEYGDIYNGSTQFIATLDDGLKFSGDQGSLSTVKLNQELSVTGGADTNNLSDNNIGVVSTPSVEDRQGNITQKAKLELKLNKDLTGLNTVTAGNAKIGSAPANTLKLTENGAVTEKTAPAGSYVTGLDNKDWNTTNPSYVSGRAATEDQLAAVSGTINKGLSFTTNTQDATNTTDNYTGYKVVNRKLGDTIAIKAGDADASRHYATTNLTTEIANNGDITIKMDESPTFNIVTATSVNLSPKDTTTKDQAGNTASAQLNAHYRDASLNPDKNVKMADGSTGMVRLHYHDGEGTIHDLATMDDGQIYAGDIKTDGTADTTGFNRKMNEKTTINGGVTNKDNLTDNNIGVVSNGTNTLTVKLAKDLKNLNSVTTGKTIQNDSGITITNDIHNPNKTVAVKGDEVTFGGNQVTNMGSGADGTADGKPDGTPTYNTLTNGANIGDVKNIAGSTTDAAKLTGDSNITVTYNDSTADGKNTVKLNDSITLGSDADKKVTIDGTAGTITAGDKVSLNGSTGTGSIGGVTIGNQTGVTTTKMDGDKDKTEDGTFVTGLSNKTWNPDSNGIVSGRAATEDQLKTVSDTVNAGWELDVNGGKQKDVTPTSRKVNFKQGQNISISGSGDDVIVATADDVRFTTIHVTGDKDDSGSYIGGITIGKQSGGNSANPGPGYYITGLENKSWNASQIQSGRAATEDQLKQVAEDIKHGTVDGDKYVTGGTATYGDDGKGSAKLTGTNGLEGTIANLHDYYVTKGEVSDDGKTLKMTKNDGTTFDVNLGKIMQSDMRLVQNPARENGKYTVDSDGNLKLTVQDANGTEATRQTITLSGLASKAEVGKGLTFAANSGTPYNAKLGDTVTVKGSAVKAGHDYSDENLTTEVDGNGNITIKMDKDLTADTMTVSGKDGKDGQIGITGKDGADGTVTTIIKTIGKNGTNGTDGTPGVNGTDGITRIVYQDGKDGEAGTTTHTVATLDDGLKFGANAPVAGKTVNPVGNKMNSTIKITGDGDKELDKYSGKNLLTSVEQDGDGNTTIHVLMDKNISADSMVVGQAGKNGKDGYIGINGKDGADGITTTIIRTEKGQAGKDGKIGQQGAPGVDGKDITRIVYQNDQDQVDGKDGSHTIATLDDGLKFSGDDNKVITKKLNEQLQFVGGAVKSKLTENNIGINELEDGKLTIQLVNTPNLGENGNLTAGKAQIGWFAGDTLDMTKDGTNPSGNKAKAGSYATGLSNKDWSVTDPEYVSGRAATEDQLAKVSEAIGNAATAAGKRTVVTVNDKSNPAEATPNATAGEYGDYDSTGGNLMIAAKKDNEGVLTYNIKLNDQLTIGQKGEPGVAGKDGKDGKVTVETKGGTTVVIGHDGEPGKDGKDGLFVTGKDGADGKSGVSITGPDGVAGKNGVDGKVGIAGKDGKDAVSISGKNGIGHIGLTGQKGEDGKDGVFTDLSTTLGTATLDPAKNEQSKSTNEVDKDDKSSRIQYQTTVTDKDGKTKTVITHEVATMDDGLKIGANAAAKDNAANPVSNKLNSTINIKGSEAKADHTYTDDNLTTTVEQDANGNTTVKVLMDKDITGNSVTVGKDSKDGEAGKDGYDGQEGSIGIAGKDGIDGKDGKQGITTTIIKTEKGQNGKDGEIGKQGAPGVDGKDITRIVYQNDKNEDGKHVVATLDDGLKFIGDDSTATPVTKKLNDMLQIRGDGTYDAATKTNNGNIQTSVEDGTIKVALNKNINLHQDGSLTVGGDKQDGSNESKDPIVIKHFDDKTLDVITGVDKDGKPISANKKAVAGDYVTGLDNKEWNVNNPEYVSGRAATEDQLKKVSDAVKEAATTAGKHTVVTVNDNKDGHDTKAKAVKGAFGEYAGTDKDNLLIAAKDDNGQLTYNIKLNDQLAIGQKGEPGVAGKDGKVTVETKGGTTVIIGHDGQYGEDGKDGISVIGKDGKNGVSITGSNGLNGKDGIDGKIVISTPGKDGQPGKDAVSISGQNGEGHIGLTGPKGEKGADGTPGKDGISIDITTDLKTATLDDGKNVKTVIKDKEGKETTIEQAPRIQYKSGDSTYEVATMDDGLKFVGNDGKEVSKKLNSTLSLTGGITDGDALKKASSKNLGVRSNKDGDGLEIVMTDTPDFTKVTVGEGDDTTKKITIGNQTVTGKKSDGTDGTEETGKYITGLDNTKWNKDNVVENRAATEGQLRDISGSITNQTQGGGFALTSDEKGTDKIVKQDLGKAIQIKGDTTYKADGNVEKAGNIKTSIDNGAIKVELNKDVDLTKEGSIKAGETTIHKDGVDTNKITIKDSSISISKDGINGGNKQITNVASGATEITKGADGKDIYKYDNETNAANIGDVKRIAGDMKTEINNNISNVTNKVDQIGQHVDNIQKDVTQLKTDVKADRTYQGDDGAAKKVKVKFGSFLSLTGGAKLADLTEEGNIGVVQKEIDDPDHKGEKIAGLSVRLAKHLNLEKTTYTSNENGQTYTSEIDGKGLTIKTGDENRNITVQDGNVNMGGNQIHNVAPGQAPGDAVNVSQLNATNYAVNKLGTRINRVGAGAAALAALHPLDFDPDDKWDFAAGYGNYKDASAVAVGAYYRPNEDTMFNIGGSFGGGENMVNAGVSFKVGQGNHVSTSRVAMAKEIKDLRQNVANLNAIVNRQSALIDKLTGTNAGMIKDKGNDLFPDVPTNHWAYEYVTKLKQAGILTGYPDGNFDGDRMMTRYEFAAIVYRAIMAGAASNPALNQDGTLDKLANEFSSEMKYIRIDTIAKDKNGKPTIERVRVIPDTQHDVQS